MEQLKLYTPADGSAGPVVRTDSPLPAGGELTLAGYYQSRILPERRLTRRRRTIRTDSTALAHWSRFGGANEKRWTLDQWGRLVAEVAGGGWYPDPAIAWITDDDLTAFVGQMLDAGLARGTVALTCRHLAGFFGVAYADGRGCLLRRPRFPTLPAAGQRRKFIPSPDAVRSVWRFSQTLSGGRGAWMPALVCLAAVYGLRPGDLVRLTWSDNFSADLADLVYVPRKTRGHRPEPMVVPVAPVLRRALEPIRRDAGAVFGNQHTVRRSWREAVRGVGLADTKPADAAGKRELRFCLKTLRRFANAQANGVQAGAGNWLLGHAVGGGAGGVNQLHYTDCYHAPDWVRDVLISDRLAEPFRD